MKVAVFGGSGFLGSHVADELAEQGYEVVVYDTQESSYRHKDQNMVVGDILDAEKVIKSVEGCDFVYNFAGIAGIDEACHDPVKTVAVNVLGTTNILEACRINQVKRFVFASTVYVYSDLAPIYRSSKQACELLIEDYQKVYDLNYTILRYGSLYGSRANHFNYIYEVIRQAVENGKIVRKGDGEEIREYIHVKDAARLSVEILSDEFKNQHIILTGNQSIRIKDLLNMIAEMFDHKISVEYQPKSEAGHYAITPYSFRPKVAKRLMSNNYYDLGQGILDIIYEVHEKSKKNHAVSTLISKLVSNDHHK